MTDYLTCIGADWLAEQVDDHITANVTRPGPVAWLEDNRYLPASVTSIPGYMSYDVNPFMREIVECFSPESPVREVNIMKGVQMTYTVAVLESILLYYMAALKTYPCMFMSADKEIVEGRIENNIIPMLQQSGFDILQSHDIGNSRKTGQTKKLLQWEGGGFMIPAGAKNADKLRSWSILLLLKDEIDAWAETVGKDGCPDVVSDSRCDAFESVRKVLRGSTPLIKSSSKIYKRYKQGDQRRYFILCRGCNFPQVIDWRQPDKEGKLINAFTWETENGTLLLESVGWHCQECRRKHYNDDKEVLLSEKEGAHWRATATPVSPDIRSYHLPAFYSPIGMKSWAGCVKQFLDAFDVETGKIKDIPAYQIFYNNILGYPFVMIGERVRFEHVSGHRRGWYSYGQIPNTQAVKYAGSPVLFITLQVDVHKGNLAVAVIGWCTNQISFLIDYVRIEDDDCTQLSSKAWVELKRIILEKSYKADDGRTYRIFCTVIDARYETDTVIKFCSQFDGWVFPIMGNDSPNKKARIKEFEPFTTKHGKRGFYITVDHYKDRLSPVIGS